MMSMRDTWAGRDLPVLNTIVEVFEETGRGMTPKQIEMRTGLDANAVQLALKALDSECPPFLSKLEWMVSGQVSFIGAPTGQARRAVDAWPTAEAIADRLVKALDEAAERQPDKERRGLLRKAAAYLGDAGRQLAIEIAATAIGRQMEA